MVKKKNSFLRAMTFMKPRIWKFSIGILGMSILNASTSVVESFMLKDIIDASISRDMVLIKKSLAMVSITAMILIVFIPIFRYMYNKCAKEGLADVRNAVFKHRGTLPISYFENNHSGNIVSRMINDADNMSKLYTERIRRLAYPFIYGLICLVPMLLLDYKLTFVLVFINCISVCINKYYSKKAREISNLIQKKAANVMESIIDVLDGIYLIKMFHVGDRLIDKYKSNNNEYIEMSLNRAKIGASIEGTNYFIKIISSIGVLALGSFLVSQGLTTFGVLVALINLQKRLNQAFLEIASYIPQFHDELSGADRIFGYLDEPSEPTYYPMEKCNKEDSYIDFNEVCFQYDKGEMLFNGINLSISKGEKIALVGTSGSGKSTVLKLMLGFYPVSSGKIVIDGKSMSERSLMDLRQEISYVPQEPYIFSGTIEENIRLGKINASKEEVIRAAKAANADEFIMNLPDQYKTEVGQRGAWLSGGQRQRIAIARAILKDSPILLLDEATSALDTESEQLVKDAIERLMINRTTIVVAHKLYTIKNVDMIYVFEKGRIVDKGNYEMLSRNRSSIFNVSNTNPEIV